MDWLRKQSPLCDNYPLGKLSKKTDTPFRERMPAFLPSFVLQRCKDTEKFKIFNTLYSQCYAYFTIFSKPSMNLLDKLIICSTRARMPRNQRPYFLITTTSLQEIVVRGKTMGESWTAAVLTFRGWSKFWVTGPVLSYLKRFRGTKRLCGYVWFRLKRLSGTKFSNRRKTNGFIYKNHVVW